MQGDFDNYKTVFQKAKDTATYYNPFVPTIKMSALEISQIPRIGGKSEAIIDLGLQMKDTDKNFKEMSKKLSEQHRQIKVLNEEIQKQK